MLTVTEVERIIRDGKSVEVVADGRGRGEGRLLLVVRNRGDEVASEWRVQWFQEGQRRRLKVGNAGKNGLSLKEALRRFGEVSKLIQDGLDPKLVYEEREREAERLKAEEAAKGSVQQLFETYVAHLQQRGRKSWAEVQRALLTAPSAAVTFLGKNTKAKDITPRAIQHLLKATHDRGPSMAAHLRAYLHGAFAFGIGREFDYTRAALTVTFDLTHNPVASVPRDAAAFLVGDRNLSSEEVGRVWHEFPEGVSERLGIALQLLLAVGGQRVQEVLSARRAEFNPLQATWVIPAARTKNHREHAIPLTPRAIGLFRRAEALAGKSEYLFPSDKDQGGPILATSLNRAASRFCQRVGMTVWTPRDIRRTCRTLMADAGEPAYLLNLHFNHGAQGVGEKHYDRSTHLDEKSALMVRWDALLGSCLGEEIGGKVVAFPGVKAVGIGEK
ncbi:tyrosine-type recombinase/integrase [Solidesulfovibrio sp.]